MCTYAVVVDARGELLDVVPGVEGLSDLGIGQREHTRHRVVLDVAERFRLDNARAVGQRHCHAAD